MSSAPYRMNRMTSSPAPDPAPAPAADDSGPQDDASKARALVQQLSDVIEHWAQGEQGEQGEAGPGLPDSGQDQGSY